MPKHRDILIVEDNPADVRLMREVLRDLEPPVKIHVSTDGDDALLFLQRKSPYEHAPRPHLIFLDFNLPKTDSRALLRFIKSEDVLKLIPVAVLTTSDADRDVREAYELHANCYLRKPVDLDGFFHTIRSAAHFWMNVAHVPVEIDDEKSNRLHLL